MKILYLLYFSLESTKFLGVKKKIIGQANAFKSLGHNVEVGYCDNNKLIIISERDKKEIKCNKGIDNYRKSIYKLLKEKKKEIDYDIIYIRFPGSVDYYLYKTAKLLKKHNIKFVLELPTYPIDKEIENEMKNFLERREYFSFFKTSCSHCMHNIFKNKIFKEDIKIVTYMPYEKIWNIDTIVIDNGINIDKNKIKKDISMETKDFNMLIVANMDKWHGIDRVIYGMKRYIEKFPQNSRNVKVIVVGDGPAREKLERLTNKEKMKQYISFVGIQDGEKLERLYQNATIAIGSLGLHRIGIEEGSTLKIKEYCAKGIPFVLGYKEREINSEFKFALQIPANEEPLDVEQCIKFYDNISALNYREEMYEFAKRKYDWKIQMKKVLERIIERKNKKNGIFINSNNRNNINFIYDITLSKERLFG